MNPIPTTSRTKLLTPKEMADEMRYRYKERIAILCEGQDPKIPPTPAQEEIASREAVEWQQRYLRENQ